MYDYRFSMIFSRTDLKKDVSGAKLDAESDFEVHLAIAHQKPGQNCKKLFFLSENFADFFFQCREIKCRESSETRCGKV